MARDSDFFDELETRSADARAASVAECLPEAIAHAKANAAGYGSALDDIDPATITDRAALTSLPVLRKADLMRKQAEMPPLGGFNGVPLNQIDMIFQSPGPIYEPGMRAGQIGKARDFWRFGRALFAAGLRAGDLVHNCFAYHFTPAGQMFESAAAVVGATVFPAGTGQTELQARAMASLAAVGYAGTPDYLKAILEKGDELGLDMSAIGQAFVSGGPLFPAMRQEYADRGITCRQSYGTADVGMVAYESLAMDGMIVDEGAIVEICTPGTGDPVPDGDIGEVVVTVFTPEFPLLRFATGDMSAVMPGTSPCGRTNMRIVGWRGRADQATKVKGMFVRPEQVADLVARHDAIERVRVTVGHDGSADTMAVAIETTADDPAIFDAPVRDILKLRGDISLCPPGSLPRDGIVIEDTRDLN